MFVRRITTLALNALAALVLPSRGAGQMDFKPLFDGKTLFAPTKTP